MKVNNVIVNISEHVNNRDKLRLLGSDREFTLIKSSESAMFKAEPEYGQFYLRYSNNDIVEINEEMTEYYVNITDSARKIIVNSDTFCNKQIMACTSELEIKSKFADVLLCRTSREDVPKIRIASREYGYYSISLNNPSTYNIYVDDRLVRRLDCYSDSHMNIFMFNGRVHIYSINKHGILYALSDVDKIDESLIQKEGVCERSGGHNYAPKFAIEKDGLLFCVVTDKNKKPWYKLL